MKNSDLSETSDFYIFNEFGKLDKKELNDFLLKIFNDKLELSNELKEIKDKGLNISIEKYISEKKVNMKILRPSKNEDGLIDHIKYGSYTKEKNKYSKSFFDEKLIENFTCFNFGNTPFPELGSHYSRQTEYVNLPCTRFKDFFSNNKANLYSQVVFEMISGEKYKSSDLEKCILLTGIFMSNTILLNIPQKQFENVSAVNPYDSIFKIVFAYSKALEYGLVDQDEGRNLLMVIKEDKTLITPTYDFSANPEYDNQILIEQALTKYMRHVEKECIKIVRKGKNKSFSFKRSLGKHDFQYVIHHIPFQPIDSIKDPSMIINDFQKSKIADQIFLRNEALLLIILDILANTGPLNWEKNISLNEKNNNSLLFENNPVQSEIFKDVFGRFEKIENFNTKLINLDLFSEITPIEIIGEIACSKVVDNAIGLIKEVMNPWFRLVKSGWVQGLGFEINELFKKVRIFYKKEAFIFKNTESFKRKFELLEQCFFIESRIIYYQQLEHLKEDLQNYFKSACNNIALTEEIERDLNQLISIFDKEFLSRAKSSIPENVRNSWNYTYERNIFKRFMVELVDEKMKMNYFKGLLVKKIKAPVSIWFHSLFPHPFGKDLSNEPFSNDDVFSYDTKENQRKTKAALMRYVISKKVENWTYKNDKDKTERGIKPEDFVFKEKPKKAIKRLEKNK